MNLNLNFKRNNSTSKTIEKFYYLPFTDILEYLVKRYKHSKSVLEIGPGYVPFPLSTVSIGFNEKIEKYIEIDIDNTPFPFEENEFDFSYCRHVLEDIQNPEFAIQQIFKCSRQGYIETPSPLIEISRGVESQDYCGYIHHRYIVWNDIDTVYFLPKYPVAESATKNPRLIEIANNYPIYWNNYILWDKPMHTVVYRNGVNMEVRKDYANLLNRAIKESIESTNRFASLLTKTI
jgi:hypothetical protein